MMAGMLMDMDGWDLDGNSEDSDEFSDEGESEEVGFDFS